MKRVAQKCRWILFDSNRLANESNKNNILFNAINRAQEQLERTSQKANEVGLQINTEKTKLMIVDDYHQLPGSFGPYQALNLNGEYIEVVKDFKYLGSMMSSSEKDMRARKGQAWGAFWKMKEIWKSKSIKIQLKVRLFKASCLAILLYGSETWTLTKQQKQVLNSFATSCYRIMLGVKRMDHVTNETIYALVNEEPLSSVIARRQLTWVGHMLRAKESELIRKYALWEPEQQLGTARRGRPKLSFSKYVAELINTEHPPSAAEIEKAAQDRAKWKKLVLECTKAVT